MDWLITNFSTIAVSFILAVIVGAIVFSMVRNKKKGKSSCGCNCSCCPMGGSCHGEKNKL